MEVINPDSGLPLGGVDAVDAVQLLCVVPSLKTGTDSGMRYITLDQLSIALNRGTAYATDGAIAIVPGTVFLTKGSAGAYTLAAPTAAQEGATLVVISKSAFAHVIASTDKLDDGVTGGAKDTATFAAFVGAAITLRATNLKWAVVSKNAVTVAGS
jgi:hypothetical protein